MTHALYITAILVLSVYAYWRNAQLGGAREDFKDAQHEGRRRADYWKRVAHINSKMHDDLQDQLNRTQRDAAAEIIKVDFQRQLAEEWSEQCQASNRSLRGWNGRYRRKIAELEDIIAEMEGEV